jgi:hypothetical protein
MILFYFIWGVGDSIVSRAMPCGRLTGQWPRVARAKHAQFFLTSRKTRGSCQWSDLRNPRNLYLGPWSNRVHDSEFLQVAPHRSVGRSGPALPLTSVHCLVVARVLRLLVDEGVGFSRGARFCLSPGPLILDSKSEVGSAVQ